MQLKKDVSVLVAENNYLAGTMVQGVLLQAGYQVAGLAADGRQAVKMTAKLKPDVVLMDIQMPDMDGIAATREIQQQCPTPVVMLTAFQASDLVEQASAAGAGAYLVKPPQRQELERAITIAMARFEDMMALRQLNQELTRLNQQLQTQNEELDSFAQTVAHDLKNPLHLIAAYSALLADDLQDEDVGQQYDALPIITTTAHKMSNIIEELLLLAGVRKMTVIPEPLNMAEIVHEAKKRLQYLIEKKGAVIKHPTEWPGAKGYAAWVEEVWVNYLSNAIKYGGEPPHIELGATESDSMVRFWVRDNGPGIPVEKQRELFIPFNRLSQVQTRGEGHGLGLSIVQRIMQKLNGHAEVESTGEQGSTFSFSLPRRSSHPTPPQDQL